MLLCLADVAEILHCGYGNVYAQVRSGALPGVRYRGHWYVDADAAAFYAERIRYRYRRDVDRDIRKDMPRVPGAAFVYAAENKQVLTSFRGLRSRLRRSGYTLYTGTYRDRDVSVAMAPWSLRWNYSQYVPSAYELVVPMTSSLLDDVVKMLPETIPGSTMQCTAAVALQMLRGFQEYPKPDFVVATGTTTIRTLAETLGIPVIDTDRAQWKSKLRGHLRLHNRIELVMED